MTIVLPSGKQTPDWCEPITAGVLQLSVAVGSVHVAIAQVSAVLITMFCGQLLRIGLMLSVAHALSTGAKTVTVKVQTMLFWLESIAV
jgi:hypothetical protein